MREGEGYDADQVREEAQKITDLVGGHGTKEDIEVAEGAVEKNFPNIPENIEGRKPPTEREFSREEYFRIVAPKVSAVVDFLLASAEKIGDLQLQAFAQFAKDKVELARQCFDYIRQETNISPEDKKHLFNLAKSALLLNLETFKYGEKTELRTFLSNHDDLARMIESRWSGAKDMLYDPSKNDIRENFRETVRRMLSAEIEARQFDPNSSIEHLERFLPTMPGSTSTEESINSYLQSSESTIREYAGMNMIDFAKYVQAKVSETHGQNLQTNPDLIKIEEELSSIKKKNLEAAGTNVNYIDRQEKLRLVRDLRFGRIAPEELQTEPAITEIYEDPDYNKIIGQNLRQHRQAFNDEVLSSIDLPPEERKTRLINLLESFGLSEPNLIAVEELVMKYFS
ncbi:MAG: hypothetical protein NTY30_03700 [Candidatus Berkelbacteria bacterium]|nr:hypothetical protein [Candidatus Berkelbacteria bacterium]